MSVSTMPAVALVTLGAVLLVVAAHAIAWSSARAARDRGTVPDVSLAAFALGLCLLALLAPVLRLSQAATLGEVLLLLGVAAAVMAAAVPLIPTPARRASAAARVEGNGSSRAVGTPQRDRIVRRGQPVLPPTPLSRPVEPLTGVVLVPGERPRLQPRSEQPRVEQPRIDQSRIDQPRVEQPRIEQAEPARIEQELAAQRLAAERLAAGVIDPAPAGVARHPISAHDAPTAPLPALRPADEATQTLIALDRAVDDVSDVLRLGRRDES